MVYKTRGGIKMKQKMKVSKVKHMSFNKAEKLVKKDDKLFSYLQNILGREILEDAEQMARLDEIDVYLESEAHMLAEQEIYDEYEAEFGENGFEDMLEDKLLAGMENEEYDDMLMYNRIFDKINSVPSLEMRQALLDRFAPEIMRGRERSMRLVARMERKLAKARNLDRMRSAARSRRVSLKPKAQKKKREDREHEDRDRKKESVADGYPY